MTGRCAVFTLEKDERFHLPQWIQYYSKHFDLTDMYIVDHESADPDVQQTLKEFVASGGNVVTITNNNVVFDHQWLVDNVHAMQAKLLEDYEYVLFTDADEIVLPVEGTLREFIEKATEPLYRCVGYEVVQNAMHRSGMYDKTLLSSQPLRWCYGYHRAEPSVMPSGELILYHVHRMDFDEAWEKNQRWARHRWDQEAITYGFSIQSQLVDYEKFKGWFYDTGGSPIEPLHDRIIEELDSFRSQETD